MPMLRQHPHWARRNELIRNQFGGRVGHRLSEQDILLRNYEGQRQRARGTVTSTVLTDTARRGIFRFYPGVQNGMPTPRFRLTI